MAPFKPTFNALREEAEFTKELLGAGATEIRKANYATKGVYFQSFTSLSTGLERIGKLCLILDHYIGTDGCFPDFKYLKNEIGHDLALLQKKAIEVVACRNLGIEFPSTPIHEAIARVLSDFAKGDRYSNINLLVGANGQADPIETWFDQVDKPLFQSLPAKKKQRIEENAHITAKLFEKSTQVRFTSERGSEINDFEEASCRTGLFEAVAPFRQLYVLQIIRFWSTLLRKLQCLAQRLGKNDIPDLSELFLLFMTDDAHMKQRKTWNAV